MMKRKTAAILSLLLTVCLLSACAAVPPTEEKADSGKLQIVATLFPQYDFARTIAGDLADVTLLLPPGAESHSYEPSPADVIRINKADLFIYTGEAMEGWAASILSGLEGDPVILDISEGIALQKEADEHEEHEHEEDAHEGEHVHEDGGDRHAHNTHVHDVDPHIFTSPRRALQMAQHLEDTLCEIDPQNSAVYRAHGADLRGELAALDAEFTAITQNAVRHKLIFGGRFAFGYFVADYGLAYDSAYDSCSSETEPAAADVARLIDEVRGEKIPVVYYEELSNPKIAQLICDETGATPLLLHSCHNISKDELQGGATYLSLMRQNAEHVKEGLCR